MHAMQMTSYEKCVSIPSDAMQISITPLFRAEMDDVFRIIKYTKKKYTFSPFKCLLDEHKIPTNKSKSVIPITIYFE